MLLESPDADEPRAPGTEDATNLPEDAVAVFEGRKVMKDRDAEACIESAVTEREGRGLGLDPRETGARDCRIGRGPPEGEQPAGEVDSHADVAAGRQGAEMPPAPATEVEHAAFGTEPI